MSPNRAWVLILIGVLISSFFGGAIHVLLSPDRLTEFVENLVNQTEPKFTIDFKSVRLRLADGWTPIFAIELDGLTIKAKDACITGAAITADRVVVPLQIIPLIVAKKARFGVVSARHLQLHWLPSVCQFTPRADGSDKIELIERFFHDRWNIEIVRTTDVLAALKIDRFDFLNADNQKIISADHFRANFDADHRQATIRANIQLGHPWVGNAAFGEFRMGAEVKADSVRIGGRGNLKEGQITADADWRIDSGKLRLLGNFTDLPLQGLLDLTTHWGVLSTFHAHLHDEWLSCGLSYNGDIRALYRSQMQTSKCEMYGDLGDWRLESPTVAIQKPFPLRWRLAGINVQKWLGEFGLSPSGIGPVTFGSTTAVVGNFGMFTGNLSLTGANQMAVDGRLDDFSVYVSNAHDNAKQKIKSIDVNLNLTSDHLDGGVKNAQIEDGHINGVASFDISSGGAGKIQMNLSRIDLSQTVQRAIWDEVMRNASLDATIEIKSFQLNQFVGHLNAKSWQPGGQWKELTTQAASTDFANVRAGVTVNPSGGQWAKLKAKASDSQKFIESSGEWDQNKNLSGRLTIVDSTARLRVKKRRVFAISGDWDAPSLQPLH